LAGSLPKLVIEELRNDIEPLKHSNITEKHKSKQIHRKYFERFDTLLGNNSNGPSWLKEPNIAVIVKEAIHYHENKLYSLLAYCIMPNHVHMLIEPLVKNSEKDRDEGGHINGRDSVSTYNVTKILSSLKKHTALCANRALNRNGAFWQHESYDHVIRDSDELERTIWYILYNPVRAGFVKEPDNWEWSYCKSEYLL